MFESLSRPDAWIDAAIEPGKHGSLQLEIVRSASNPTALGEESERIGMALEHGQIAAFNFVAGQIAFVENVVVNSGIEHFPHDAGVKDVPLFAAEFFG